MSIKIFQPCWLIVGILMVLPLLAQEKPLQEEQDFRFSAQLADKGMYDLAAMQFLKYVEHYSDSPQAPVALFRAAECYEAAGETGSASQTYLQLLLKYPQSSIGDKALFNRAKILAASGEHLDAARTFERIRLFAAESELIPLAMLSAGEQYLAAKDLKRSLESAYYILERYSSHPLRFDARYLTALIYHLQGKSASALAELDKTGGERLEPDLQIKTRLLRAQILQELGRYALADSLYESLFREPSGNDSVGVAAVQLVQSLTSRGLHDRASEVIERALHFDMDPALKNRLYRSQADLFFVRNDHLRALQSLDKIEPENLTPWQRMSLSFCRATILQKQNQLESALPLWLAVGAQPDTTPAGLLLQKRALVAASEILSSLQRPGEALRLLRQMYDSAPSLRDVILLQKGRIQQDVMHDWPGARLTYSMLLDFYPDSPLADDAWLGVARAHEQEGQYAQALTSYQQYQKLFIGADEYDYASARIVYLRDFAPMIQANYPTALQSSIRSILLSEGKTENLLILAREQIRTFRDYPQGQAFLRQAFSTAEGETDVIDLLYWMGLCHARLAQAAEGEKRPAEQRTQSDSLVQIFQLMAERAPQDSRTRQIQFETVEASLKLIDSAYERAVVLNNVLDQTGMPDSLVQPLQYQAAQLWFTVAKDSANNLPLFRRAASICRSLLQSPVNEELAGNTLLLQYQIFTSMQMPDSAAWSLRTCIDRYSNAPAVVEAMWTLARNLEKNLAYQDAAALYHDLALRFYYTRHGDKAQGKYCQLLFKLGNDEAAQKCVDVSRQLPDLQELRYYLQDEMDDESLWLSARLQIRRQNPIGALKTLKEYLFLSLQGAHRAEALMTMAELYSGMKNLEAALGHYEELISAFPQDTLAQLARLRSAELYFNQNDYATSLKIYQAIKSSSSGDTQRQAAAREVICLFRMGSTARARTLADIFKKTYKDRASEAVFLKEDALFCLTNKDFKTAEDLFKELSSRYRDLPEGADGDLGLARLYVTLNRTEDALKMLTNIPVKYSDPRVLSVAYVNLGEFYYENRQLENCLAAGRKALEFEKTSPERQRALVLLIRVFDDLRLWDSAITLLREYVAVYPDAEDHFMRRVQIGVFLINLREYDRGIAELRDLLPEADAENEAEIQYWIAHAYNERGNMADAIIEYLKVKYVCRPTKLPWGTTALYEAGQAYVKLGQLKQARALFQEIVKEMGTGDQFGRVANERIREIDTQLSIQARDKNG